MLLLRTALVILLLVGVTQVTHAVMEKRSIEKEDIRKNYVDTFKRDCYSSGQDIEQALLCEEFQEAEKAKEEAPRTKRTTALTLIQIVVKIIKALFSLARRASNENFLVSFLDNAAGPFSLLLPRILPDEHDDDVPIFRKLPLAPTLHKLSLNTTLPDIAELQKKTNDAIARGNRSQYSAQVQVHTPINSFSNVTTRPFTNSSSRESDKANQLHYLKLGNSTFNAIKSLVRLLILNCSKNVTRCFPEMADTRSIQSLPFIENQMQRRRSEGRIKRSFDFEQASLYRDRKLVCAAQLFNQETLIVPAFCVKGAEPSELSFRVNSLGRNSQMYDIKRYSVHQVHDGSSLQMALLKSAQRVYLKPKKNKKTASV